MGNLQSARPSESFIYHVRPVGHANDKDIVQGVHPIYLGQQLVHHSVIHARAAGDAASLFADGIDFVKDDDV